MLCPHFVSIPKRLKHSTVFLLKKKKMIAFLNQNGYKETSMCLLTSAVVFTLLLWLVRVKCSSVLKMSRSQSQELLPPRLSATPAASLTARMDPGFRFITVQLQRVASGLYLQVNETSFASKGWNQVFCYILKAKPE